MKILVCGGRKFFDWPALKTELDHFHLFHGPVTCVIQGGAAGADRLAKHWANTRKILCHEYPANWKELGRVAGMVRNRQMLDKNPDIEYVIAFPGDYGTFGMVREALRRGIKVMEPLDEPPPF